MPNVRLAVARDTTPGNAITHDHFGTNALFQVNTDAEGTPDAGFEAAVDALGVTYHRFPGGNTENMIDLFDMPNGRLRAEVANFFDWCRDRDSAATPQKVVVTLPTKTDYSYGEIHRFIEALATEYGDLIGGFEIGNEYSIGKRDAAYDRSEHPENADADYIPAMGETDYGKAANLTIKATVDALDRVQAATGLDAEGIDIILQAAETNGGASDFKGTHDFRAANDAILAELDTRAMAAVDAVVFHYYYNVEHSNHAFEDNWRERRSLDERIEDIESRFDKEIDTYVTEWNVVKWNETQQGLPATGTILEMFQEMIEMGVDHAQIWPLQHRVWNNVAGNRDSGEFGPTFVGAAFDMLKSTFQPQQSVTGRISSFHAIEPAINGGHANLEVNAYASDYAVVYQISSRAFSDFNVALDLSAHADGAAGLSGVQIGIDRDSADGLVDFADENGRNRLGRREIDADELAELRKLPFFDEDSKDHLHEKNGKIFTYLAPSHGFIPRVANPQTVDDYDIFSEADAAPDTRTLEGLGLDALSQVQLRLKPFEVAQITVELEKRLEGGAGGDRLAGGVGRDVILGREGNDTLVGGEGNDELKGGFGDDLLLGGDGDDRLTPGAGIDTVRGGAGQDTLILGGKLASYDIFAHGDQTVLFSGENAIFVDDVESFDFDGEIMSMSELLSHASRQAPDARLYVVASAQSAQSTTATSDSSDRILAGDGHDRINAFGGNDTILSGGGADDIDAGDGDDTVQAGDGNDTVRGGQGRDVILGGGGRDAILGGGGGDVIDAGAEADAINGNGGGDVIEGGEGNDTLRGGTGNDVIFGDAGNDEIRGEGGDDVIEGGAGNDRLYGNAAFDLLRGGDGDDMLNGGMAHDTLEGGAGHDTLIGLNGSDELSGGDGDDLLQGNAGQDLIRGGLGNDVIEGGIGFDTLYGDEGDDRIEAGNGFDRVQGGAGNDSLFGNFGNDVLSGGAGNDLLHGGLGADRLDGGTGNDLLQGWEGRDHLSGGDGRDHLQGGEGHDTLDGGNHMDTLEGGTGNDLMRGGGGLDTFVFRAGDGADTIADFESGTDEVRLDSALFDGPVTGPAQIADHASLGAEGFVQLDFGEDRLSFQGVTNIQDVIEDITIV